MAWHVGMCRLQDHLGACVRAYPQDVDVDVTSGVEGRTEEKSKRKRERDSNGVDGCS